MHDKKLRS